MFKTHIKQVWNLVNEYFHSNQIDPSQLVDYELVRWSLKACQKSTPKGVSISKQGNQRYLRFKTTTKPVTANNSCNEDSTRDGCVNASRSDNRLECKAELCFEHFKWQKNSVIFWVRNPL